MAIFARAAPRGRWRFLFVAVLPQVGSPVFVMHGRLDKVIPFHHGEALFAAATGPKRQLWVDRANHNDLFGVATREFAAALAWFSVPGARSN